MIRNSIRARRLGVMLAAAMVVAVGCGSASQISYAPVITPSPAPTMTPLPTPPVTPTPEATPTTLASATATAAATDTATDTATPGAAGTACFGSTTLQGLLAEAAPKIKFQLYCAMLGKGWYFSSGSYKLAGGAWMTIDYKTSKGQKLHIAMGNFCPAMTCWPVDTTIGPASFGDLSGTLVIADATPTYAVYVDPGTIHSYVITGTGMSQATFELIAAAVIRYPDVTR